MYWAYVFLWYAGLGWNQPYTECREIPALHTSKYQWQVQGFPYTSSHTVWTECRVFTALCRKCTRKGHHSNDGLTYGTNFTNTTWCLRVHTTTTTHAHCKLLGSSHLLDQGYPLHNFEGHKNDCRVFPALKTVTRVRVWNGASRKIFICVQGCTLKNVTLVIISFNGRYLFCVTE